LPPLPQHSKIGESQKMTLLQRVLRIVAFVFVLLFVVGFKDCYKPVTKSGLPQRIKTVAVPPFENKSLRYKLESRFTDATIRELIKRGRGLKVQGDREGADAVIEGTIKSFTFSGVLLDDKGRARVFEVTIVAAVTVRDEKENRVLYDNQNVYFRDSFEFTSDPRSFFNEEDPAVERIARSFAESVVSIIANGFGVNEIK
jgi:hypothetical protein